MKLGYIFVAAFAISFGIVVFGEAGVLSAYRKSQENARLEARIIKLEEENTKLASQIELIGKSSQYLEQTIRKSLSMVAPDELLFEFQN